MPMRGPDLNVLNGSRLVAVKAHNGSLALVFSDGEDETRFQVYLSEKLGRDVMEREREREREREKRNCNGKE